MQFVVKKITQDFILNEHKIIGFDSSYVEKAQEKHNFLTFKIFDLSLPQANILKQTALSAGCECSLNKEILTASISKTDAILSGTIRQINTICEKMKLQPFSLPKLSEEIKNQIEIQEKPALPKIVGILNVTDNSFSDGGKYINPEIAIKHALNMVENGAEIIDIGAESTAPNSNPVFWEDECARIVPLIVKLREFAPNIKISVDTRNSETAKEAIAGGADIINDVSGFNWDEKIVDIALKFKKKYILTHSISDNSADDGAYSNLIDDIFLELKTKSDFLKLKGFNEEDIIIDVGFGFNKNSSQNYELLNRISEFKSLGYQIMAGVSRKRFLREISPKIDENLDILTSISSFYLALQGVQYLRVHNVYQTKLALDFYSKLTKCNMNK